MPRDGFQIMSKIPGTAGVPGEAIESAKYNATVDDLINDLNTPRPIVAGGTGANSVAGSLANFNIYDTSAPTLAALKSQSTTIYRNILLTEAGRCGVFTWRTGNFTTQIASDTSSGIYVKADAIAASAGAWVRSYQGELKAEWYGCIGDGVTDDTVRFLAFLTACQQNNKLGVLTKSATYLLSTWNLAGVAFASLHLDGRGATIKGASSASSIFIKPSGEPKIQNVIFDTWLRPFVRLLADGGSITGGYINHNTFTNCAAPVDFECPTDGIFIDDNLISGGSGAVGIRIGTNDDTLEAGWTNVSICRNTIKNRATTGTTGNYPILSYAQYGKIDDNQIKAISSFNAECFGIYTKMRWGTVCGNVISNINSTGSSGGFDDVVGIALKGDNRTSTTTSPGGYKLTCSHNVVRQIGVQSNRGTGIRSQNQENIIANNVIENCGANGIDANDSGPIGSVITGNTIRGLDILGANGIWLSGPSQGHNVSNNQIVDFLFGIRLDGGATLMGSANVSGNYIQSGRASGAAFRFASGVVKGTLISNNSVQLFAGSIFLFDSVSHERTAVLNNDFSLCKDFSIPFIAGSTPAELRANNNIGYKTRNGGLATVPNGAGGLVINHGMMAAPQGVVATMFNNNANIATSLAFTATQLTISHNAAMPQSISWAAWVGFEHG